MDSNSVFSIMRSSLPWNWIIFVAHLCVDMGASDIYFPDSKVHGASKGPIWGPQDPGGPHVGPMNFAIWVYSASIQLYHAIYINYRIWLYTYFMDVPDRPHSSDNGYTCILNNIANIYIYIFIYNCIHISWMSQIGDFCDGVLSSMYNCCAVAWCPCRYINCVVYA